jgi:nucleotide-binding universal stress UspA family protein
MSIVCGISARTPGAGEAARALQAAGLGPLFTIDLDHARDAAEVLFAAAAAHRAELLVVAAGPHPDDVVKHVAHRASVPLLVVRDPEPFVRWGSERPLRAVFGWDDTATTAAALEPLVALRQHGPVDVEVVHVYFPDDTGRRYGIRVRSMVEPTSEIEALLGRDIAHQLGEVPGAGAVKITPALGLGHIGEHLLEHATTADLITVGTHHRGGLRRLSSVAERVLDDAHAAVLLVPLRADAHTLAAPDFQVAVVATDGSAFANRAIPYAYRLVPDGEVHLVRVVENDARVDDAALKANLMALRPDSSTRTVAHVVHDRDPAHAIAVTAEQLGADVVCIASHARAGIARVLIGSVVDRLLHVCRRPVLVLHPAE